MAGRGRCPAAVQALLVTAAAAAAVTAVAASEGDAGRGQGVFARQCAVCHTTVPGYHREGPSLAGIVGRQAGTVESFSHYRGLKGSDVVWDRDSLDAWLADPRGFLDGRDTTMTFKLADDQARADVITYLMSLE